MKPLAFIVLGLVISLSDPLSATAAITINHDQKGASGDFTITGHDFPTTLAIDAGIHNVDYIIFGAPNGNHSSDLRNPPDGTPSDNTPTTYPGSRFPDTDTMRFTLNIDSRNGGNEMVWIDIAAQGRPVGDVPEPATIIIWSLLGAGSWLGMRVWRRDRPAAPQPWTPEARQAIHDMLARRLGR